MKRCPACSREYADVGLKFCLDDGTELVSKVETEAPATAVMPAPEDSVPKTITASAPLASSHQEEIPPTVASSDQAKRSLGPMIIVVAVLLVLGLIILIASIFVPSRDSFAGFFLTRTARRLPMVILVLAGIAFAALRWKFHPRVSLMTSVALVLFIVDLVVYTSLLYWLPNVVEPMRLSASATRWFYSIVYFIEDIVFAAIIFLLVAAAFTGRKVLPRGNT